MNFKNIPYQRVDIDPIPQSILALVEAIKNAASAEKQLFYYKELDIFKKRLMTMCALCNVRHTIDTRDEFYDQENDYYNAALPAIEQLFADVGEILLSSPFRREIESAIGSIPMKNMEMIKRAYSPEIKKELQEENKLQSRYQKLMAKAQIPFRGKILTFPQLTAYQENADRQIREDAFRAESDYFSSISEELDEIFDSLVHIRTKMAKKLGFESFSEMAYYRRTRNCYNRDDVAAFRKQVVSHIVPYTTKLLARQAVRNKIDAPMVWDRRLVFPNGNPVPTDPPEVIFKNGKKMYEELSPETGEFFNFMLEHDLFDVLSKEGKANGGYCTSLPDYNAPFVFANFNGTSGDIEVLTHECGHALESYLSMRSVEYTDQAEYTMDIAEIHSMSMEYFTHPWMKLFFKENTEKYFYAHIFSALKFLPYGCMVDDFQHIMYDKPDLTPAQRHEEWVKLEQIYRPDQNCGNLPYHTKGGIWQEKLHIFLYPFYYIDYCFAQIVALYFWVLMQKDQKDAWNRYIELLKKAGTRDYITLVKEAGFVPPTEEGAIANVARTAYEYLTKLEEIGFD